MMKSKKKQIVIQDGWRYQLTKMRCWISGYKAGRHVPGSLNLDSDIPGEDVLRQIILAIDEAKGD